MNLIMHPIKQILVRELAKLQLLVSLLVQVILLFHLPLILCVCHTFLFRKTNEELIVTGPYGLVRHPMYTTSILGVWITPTMVSI